MMKTIPISDSTFSAVEKLATESKLSVEQASEQLVTGAVQLVKNGKSIEVLEAEVAFSVSKLNTGRRMLQTAERELEMAKEHYIKMRSFTEAYRAAAREKEIQQSVV